MKFTAPDAPKFRPERSFTWARKNLVKRHDTREVVTAAHLTEPLCEAEVEALEPSDCEDLLREWGAQ